MQNNLDKYTQEVKSRLDKNYLSPLFIRLANLLYVNEHYEECISVCKTGLIVYPNYFTAKLILLKALLKAEYINEAEQLFDELKSRMTNKTLLEKFKSNIKNLKSISRQEKIYYPKSVKNKADYKFFEKTFQRQENLFSDFSINSFLSGQSAKILENDGEFRKFMDKFDSFHFENISPQKTGKSFSEIRNKPVLGHDSELLGKIKIITETLADIYADQGNYKEAFDAYNLLLRAESSNSKRIEEKLHELERNISQQDNI